ncbi:hypothetical protein ACQCT6_10445 [Cytobacillus gottheilii]|uniref:hypothetical protein n=1 Tax=Cytobacillus gottheilii TaxID=859144 RepID=UPI003CE7672B
MVNYRKILELHFEKVSQRTISSSTGHSRNTVSDVIQRAKKLGVENLNDTMTNPWKKRFSSQRNRLLRKGTSQLIGKECITPKEECNPIPIAS